MGTIQGALMKAKLVTEEDLKRQAEVEAAHRLDRSRESRKREAEHEAAERKDYLAKQPLNRLGKTVAVAYWISENRIPGNVSRLCCQCGRSDGVMEKDLKERRLTPERVGNRLLVATSVDELGHRVAFSTCMACLDFFRSKLPPIP